MSTGCGRRRAHTRGMLLERLGEPLLELGRHLALAGGVRRALAVLVFCG